MDGLEQRIAEDVKAAMRSGDKLALGVLRGLRAAIKNAAIEKGAAGGALSDVEVVGLLRKQIKQREDSAASYEAAGRGELAEVELGEVAILEGYLPEEMGEAELGAMVAAAIEEVGASDRKDMGAVMAVLRERAAGRVDNKTLSQRVMAALG